MKLDKRQINALAQSFYKEIKSKLDKANKEKRSKQLEKFRADYDKGLELLKDNKYLSSININISSHSAVNLSRNKSFDNYTGNYSFNELLDKEVDIKLSDTERDIVLATIDSSSVDDIMKFLKNKYK